MAKSVLNARSPFSTAVITPVTSSFLPVARSSTALLASCWSLETSSRLLLSMSAKLPAPVAGPEEPVPRATPWPASFPTRLFSTPLIISNLRSQISDRLRDEPQGGVDHPLGYFHHADVRLIRARRL